MVSLSKSTYYIIIVGELMCLKGGFGLVNRDDPTICLQVLPFGR